MLNNITIAGRFVRDPELRMTQNETPVCSFSIACERDGGKETDFIDCTAWRHTADFISKYFTKGMLAVIVGRLQIRKYTDKDGNKRTAPEVVVDRVYFGESKRKSDLDERPPFPDEKDAQPPVDMEQTKRDLDELSQFSNVRFADADGALPWE